MTRPAIYIMPGGIKPYPSRNAVHGRFHQGRFQIRYARRPGGWHHDGRRFCNSISGKSLLDALKVWDNKSAEGDCDYSFHVAITWWSQQVFEEMEAVVREKGINSFKHFMAYKGMIMLNDDDMYSSFRRCSGGLGALPLVHADGW